MLKGKTKIELRNAKTGALERETKDDNLVTNAVYNLANPPNIVKAFSGTSEVFMPGVLNPLLNTCFGGIMLFDKNIPEDANYIIPANSDLNSVGNANVPYSGALPYVGTLNAAETKILDKGKRYVWDFATDKANGTIRSVALSCPNATYFGADIGSNGVTNFMTSVCRFSGYFENAIIFINNSYSLSGGNSPSIVSGIVATVPIGSYEENKFLFYKAALGGKSMVIEKVSIDVSKLGLSSRSSVIREQKTIETQCELSPEVTADDEFFYSFYPVSATKFAFVKVNALTLEVVEDQYVEMQDTAFTVGCVTQGVYHNEKYYICKQVSSTEPYLISGAYIINAKDLSDYKYYSAEELGLKIYGEARVSLLKYVGSVYFIPASNNSSFAHRYAVMVSGKTFKNIAWIGDYGGSSVYGPMLCRPLPSPWIKKPYILCCNNYMSNFKNEMRFAIDTCFLSTINNLGTPVIKNETQTMKVTYEITEV